MYFNSVPQNATSEKKSVSSKATWFKYLPWKSAHRYRSGSSGGHDGAASGSKGHKGKKRRLSLQPSPAYMQTSKEYWMEYCRNTSLHGLQYVGEQNRPMSERLFWIFAFTFCIILSFCYIAKVWEKWNDSPVIVSFSDKSTRIWEIPFPAVTICSEIKVNQTLFNYTATALSNNRSDEQSEHLEYSSLVCNSRYSGLNHTNERALEYIGKVAPKLEEVIKNCKWREEMKNCSNLFSSVLTDDGLCYTFNTLAARDLLTSITDSQDWDPESGYIDGDSPMTYPHRALTSGSGAGLSIELHADYKFIDPLCRRPVHGFKMVLHNPAEFPQVQHQFFRVPLDREVVVGVKPSAIVTTEGLRSYTPERRQCFFSNERKLRFFRFYTQDNCEFECLSNHTLHHCGCLAYYMPRTENSTICGAGSNGCIKKAAELLYNNKDMVAHCNCQPACSEIRYDVEISHAALGWETKSSVGIVSIYFKDKQFITSQRSELYGTTDFLANCGGLLGLFLGFSILSLVELVYFFTLRLCCNIRRAKLRLAKRMKEIETSRKIHEILF
ncbi:pickpocket protein 28-like isoform X2 [Periplaneta americana]|uniref:pickpocket protein 28-like isoform X2 n=1 Tax=Periplaneta americana TaxID=6978 RepID=UPI0037E6FB86